MRLAERRIRMAERQAQALAHAFTPALDAHPIAARLSNQERAELVTLFALQLALLEAAPPDVEAQGARSDSYNATVGAACACRTRLGPTGETARRQAQ